MKNFIKVPSVNIIPKCDVIINIATITTIIKRDKYVEIFVIGDKEWSVDTSLSLDEIEKLIEEASNG